MPSTIGKWKLFRIKHITVLEDETFLRNKHEIAFFEIKCTFFGRKENTIRVNKIAMKSFSKNLSFGVDFKLYAPPLMYKINVILAKGLLRPIMYVIKTNSYFKHF